MTKRDRLGRIAAVVALAAASAVGSGCSTVMGDESSASKVVHERVALTEAAEAVATTRWPATEEQSAGGGIFGAASGAQDAAGFYLARMPQTDRKAAVLSDAATHLAAASTLADAANAAARSLHATENDVAIVETAISDLRRARNVYVQSLKALAAEKAATTDDVGALKRDFDVAMKSLGAAADALAERVEKERARSFAGPHNLAGT